MARPLSPPLLMAWSLVEHFFTASLTHPGDQDLWATRYLNSLRARAKSNRYNSVALNFLVWYRADSLTRPRDQWL